MVHVHIVHRNLLLLLSCEAFPLYFPVVLAEKRKFVLRRLMGSSAIQFTDRMLQRSSVAAVAALHECEMGMVFCLIVCLLAGGVYELSKL